MKEFDIYLNKRLTECDIIVCSIPYRDDLTVMNRLILESCVDSYTLCKFIAAQNGSELVSHIDDMLKTCIERLNLGAVLDANSKFNAFYSLYPPETAVQISANNVKLLANTFIEVNNALQLATEPLFAYVSKSVGSGETAIEIKSNANALKNSIERFYAPIDIGADIVSAQKQSFLDFENNIIVKPSIIDLYYQITTAIDTSLRLAVAVLDTEIHFSLGSNINNIVIGADIRDGDYATKLLSVQSAVFGLTEATALLTQFMHPSMTNVFIDMEVACLLKRYRLLVEMDEDVLFPYDDMTLDEVGFITL